MSITIADSTNDIVVTFLDDKGIVNIEELTIPSTAAASQGDYVVLTNAYGAKIAAWLDINANGTAPTGAAYVAATTKLKISIVTGGTAIANAAIFATTLDATAWANSATIAAVGDGTLTITQVIGAVVTAADPHNTGDTGLGTITSDVLQVGAATRITRVDYLPKEGLKVIEYARDGCLYLITQEGYTSRTTPDGRYKYSEITSPSTASLTALVAQINTWKSANGSSYGANTVTNEDANVAQMNGSNSVFTTTYPFVYHSIEVFFNELKMTLNVDYTEDGAAGEITFLTITPDATLPTPDTLTFNYIKL